MFCHTMATELILASTDKDEHKLPWEYKKRT